MRDMEAITVARLLVNEFFCRFGLPDTLHTDQGRNFQSTLIKEICSLVGVHKTRTHLATSSLMVLSKDSTVRC